MRLVLIKGHINDSDSLLGWCDGETWVEGSFEYVSSDGQIRFGLAAEDAEIIDITPKTSWIQKLRSFKEVFLTCMRNSTW